MSQGLGFGKRRLIEDIVLKNWDLKRPELKTFSYNELLFVIQEMLDEEGKKYFERRVSRAGHKVFKHFVQHLLYRNIANYDSMILITSEKGTGKSSAAIMMARAWCLLLGIRFNPARHIAYNNADVMRKIDQLNKFEPIVCVGQNTKIRIKHKGIEHSVEIKKLVGRNDFEVLTYNKEKDIFEYQQPEKVIETKKAITWELELENGIKINATPEHLFLTKNRGYVQLQHLTDGDEVILQSRKCKVCGKEFFNKQWDVLTCSKKCSNSNTKNQIPYRIKYPEKQKKWYKKYWSNKFANNIVFRLKHNIGTRMSGAINNYNENINHNSSFLKLLGCKTYDKLREHLEKQFKPGMSWENYGSKWSVDHIRPVCSFNLLDERERFKCYNYKNLQPLWKWENSSKGGKYDC